MKSLILKCTLALLAITSSVHANEKPNILVILADDLGYGDLGFTGSKVIQTPNLDRLAENGMILKNGYVTHPYCGPSRAGLVTGRYQARFGLEINLTNSHFDMHNGLPLTEQTFATRLQKSGYETGIIGKWHLGASYPFHPNNRGFDYFYGFLSGGHSYLPENITTNKPLVNADGNPHYSANEGSYQPLMRNNKAGEFDEYLTTALSKDAAKFVARTEKPFCLYLAYNAPHLPLEAPAETKEKYNAIKDKKRRTYAAMIDEMDQGIGRVIAALEESGKLHNTLIFFLSDNGGHRPDKDGYTICDNGNFLGGKGSMHEGGCHVPFIVHWPAGISKTGTFDGLVSALDIAATAVAVGDGDRLGNALEGVNLIPYLNGEKTGSPHQALYWRIEDGAAWGVRTVSTKYILDNHGATEPELFDMANDPYESTNIIEEAPERRAEMAKLWNEWNQSNTANAYLQSGAYQKERLRMYEELRKRLDEKAAKTPLLIIE